MFRNITLTYVKNWPNNLGPDHCHFLYVKWTTGSITLPRGQLLKKERGIWISLQTGKAFGWSCVHLCHCASCWLKMVFSHPAFPHAVTDQWVQTPNGAKSSYTLKRGKNDWIIISSLKILLYLSEMIKTQNSGIVRASKWKRIRTYSFVATKNSSNLKQLWHFGKNTDLGARKLHWVTALTFSRCPNEQTIEP